MVKLKVPGESPKDVTPAKPGESGTATQDAVLAKEAGSRMEELEATKRELEKLKRAALNKMNEFGRAGYEKYILNARALRFNPSGTTPGLITSLFSRLSGTQQSSIEELELFGIPEIVNYDRAARLLVAQVQGVIEDMLSPGRSFSRSGLSVNDKDPSLVSVQKVVKIPPKLMLLTQIRADLRGQADEHLVYMKEHFVYPGERSFIFHHISSYPRTMLFLPPRDFLTMTAWAKDENEPDVLWLGSRSLKNDNILPAAAGCTRGVIKMSGMRLEPTELQHNPDYGNVVGTKVTMVFSVDLQVWMSRPSGRSQIYGMLEQFIEGCEMLGLDLMDENRHTDLIERYVDNPRPGKRVLGQENAAETVAMKQGEEPVVISDEKSPPRVELEEKGEEPDGMEEEQEKKAVEEMKRRRKKKKEKKDKEKKEKKSKGKGKKDGGKGEKKDAAVQFEEQPEVDSRLKYAIVEETDSDSSDTESESEDDSSEDDRRRRKKKGRRKREKKGRYRKYYDEDVTDSEDDSESDDGVDFEHNIDDLLDNYSFYKGKAMDVEEGEDY